MLGSGYRTELGFLLIASIVAFLIPLSGQISLVLGFALLGLRAEAATPASELYSPGMVARECLRHAKRGPVARMQAETAKSSSGNV